jgi:hypothetical protein
MEENRKERIGQADNIAAKLRDCQIFQGKMAVDSVKIGTKSDPLWLKPRPENLLSPRPPCRI